MTTEGFYRRPLPAPLVAFASDEGRRLFREALAAGGMEGYFALAEQFHTQSEPAFCGLGTLVMVLNALAIDPGRPWRGPWRWYSEELLDCCRPLDVVRVRGITLDEFACLARCNGATARLVRATQSTEAGFRARVRETAASAAGPYLAVAYSRAALGQTGDGHFSPVAGYHAGRDLALVLDAARFKYPPHWVPVALLWEAQRPVDPVTGRARGYVVLGRDTLSPNPSLCRLSLEHLDWSELARRLTVALPQALAAAAPASPEALVTAVFRELPGEVAAVLRTRSDAAAGVLSTGHAAVLEKLLGEVRATALHAVVARALVSPGPSPAMTPGEGLERATLLLLAFPDAVFGGVPPAVRAVMAALRDPAALPPLLRAEVARLGGQIDALVGCGCEVDGALATGGLATARPDRGPSRG